jgi:hypothetical protein
MAPDFVTVYQVSKEWADWPFAFVGAIPIVVGVAVIFGKRTFKWRQPHWLMPIFFCGFGILWLCTAGVSVLRDDSRAFNAFKKGDYQLVEGYVEDFYPMPYEGHQSECFSVQEKRFCYSDYQVTPGFHNAASHGGPIRSGLLVRIAYSGDTILRLDIPKDQVLNPAQSASVTSLAEREWQDRGKNDPFEERMEAAFLFTVVFWTLWWNLQWRRFMRFWVRPPNRLRVQYLFRAFFAMNLLGVLTKSAQQLQTHPIPAQEIVPTLTTTAIMCAVVALMSVFSLWMIERRDRQANERLPAVP